MGIGRYYGNIVKLQENDVFMMGTNEKGFHGAGAAGYASFGISGNVWRKFKYDQLPDGWKGRWNVKGVARGLQEGKFGKSYGIVTVTKPGAKRSVPLTEIKEQVAELYRFAQNEGKHYTFFVAQGANNTNLNGYSAAEMVEIYGFHKIIPTNVYFERDFAKLMEKFIVNPEEGHTYIIHD